MTTSRQVTAKADNGSLTLGELKSFIAELDNAGAADTTVIKARVSFSGTIKSVTADAVRFGDAEPR